jgi:hypothetical protein
MLAKHIRPALAVAALMAGFATMPAMADTVTFHAALNGASEVPPNDTKGTGTIEVTYDTATRQMRYDGSYSGLTGPETAAHFHGPAAPGKNAGIMVPVEAKSSPFSGSATLTEAQATALTGGQMYFNVHTAAHPNGEIRGQLAK